MRLFFTLGLLIGAFWLGFVTKTEVYPDVCDCPPEPPEEICIYERGIEYALKGNEMVRVCEDGSVFVMVRPCNLRELLEKEPLEEPK